ncbi:hypothetical protein A6P54_02580 [Bacillus sp. MKU004]|nr:hypothetical protein A6P54_02580 [Bacillus sp. MKU004]
MNIVNVKGVFEIHKYHNKVKCNCSGNLELESLRITEVKDGYLYDKAIAKCSKCNEKKSFIFRIKVQEDISKNEDIIHIKKLWPEPKQGPYINKDKEYKKRMKLEINNTENDDNFSTKWKKISDETNPKIGDRYQVIGHRRGGMGIVYLCLDTFNITGIPRIVICKTLNIEPDLIDIKAIEREANILIELEKHPNLVSVVDVINEARSRIVLITEAVNPFDENNTLEGVIKELHKEANKDEIIDFSIHLLKSIIDGIEHGKKAIEGFIHGDLKPSNILIDELGLIKLSDFGLSSSSRLGAFKIKDGIYTKEYLAPEVFSEGCSTEKSDVYAIGLILYEAINGSHPFDRYVDIDDLIYRHKNTTIPKLENIPLWVSSLIMKCLEKKPEERPTIEDIRKIIEHNVNLQGEYDQGSKEGDIKEVEYNNRAASYINLGDIQNALKNIQKSELSKLEVKANLAVALSKNGDFELAEQLYKHIYRSGQELPEVFFINYASHKLRHNKQFENGQVAITEGIALCEIVLEKNKSNLNALIVISALYNTLGQNEKALVTSRKGKILNPKNCLILYEYAFSNYKLGKFGKALTAVNKIIKLDPTFREALLLKSQIESEKKKNKPR